MGSNLHPVRPSRGMGKIPGLRPNQAYHLYSISFRTSRISCPTYPGSDPHPPSVGSIHTSDWIAIGKREGKVSDRDPSFTATNEEDVDGIRMRVANQEKNLSWGCDPLRWEGVGGRDGDEGRWRMKSNPFGNLRAFLFEPKTRWVPSRAERPTRRRKPTGIFQTFASDRRARSNAPSSRSCRPPCASPRVRAFVVQNSAFPGTLPVACAPVALLSSSAPKRELPLPLQRSPSGRSRSLMPTRLLPSSVEAREDCFARHR